jgi:hypothetical protein
VKLKSFCTQSLDWRDRSQNVRKSLPAIHLTRD